MSSMGNGYKKFVVGVVGMFLLILGVTLILTWWRDVVSLFKGASGIIIAIAGLTTLYWLKK